MLSSFFNKEKLKIIENRFKAFTSFHFFLVKNKNTHHQPIF